jgi:hypothetical protein
MTTFRKGDKVSVTGIVMYDPSPGKNIFIDVGASKDIWVDPDSIQLVQAYFEVGDECSWPGSLDQTMTGTALAISNGHAWIDMGDGQYCTRLLTKIDRIDSYPEKADSDD